MGLKFTDMEPVTVSLDGTDHLYGVPAYIIPGNRWNGWECPYFTVDTIRAWMDAWNRYAREVEESNEPGSEVTYRYGWNEETDLPYALSTWEDDGTYDDMGTVTTVDGVELVTLGYASWTWFAVEPGEV